MTDLKYYFDGTNGYPVTGTVTANLLLSCREKFNTVASLPFEYSDSLFDNSGCSYRHDLCLMSLGLCMPAFSHKNDGDIHIRGILRSIGCDDRTIHTKKFDATSPTDDSCGYAFAAKRLKNDYHLIPVVIRSHRYGGEWVSNVHVVDESCPDHSFGFKTAADKTYDALSAYIEAHGFNRKKIKLWVVGFSRGAAIANLLGARLNLESDVPKDNIFCYTFATPCTVYDRANCFMDNIFNIVSEIDAVPRVPICSWGFTRYGTDLYLPCSARRGPEEYARLRDKMSVQFDALMKQLDVTDAKYTAIDDQEIAVDLLMDCLDDLLISPEKYIGGGYQGIIMEYMKSKIGGFDFELRTFLRFLLDGNSELADELCALIEQWNELAAFEKVQRITKLPARRRQGEKTPAGEIISMALNIFMRYARKLTATKVTGGEQDYYYEQLVSMIVDTYQNANNSAILMQHWPETYLAWLKSADEKELFRTTSYPRRSVK